MRRPALLTTLGIAIVLTALGCQPLGTGVRTCATAELPTFDGVNDIEQLDDETVDCQRHVDLTGGSNGDLGGSAASILVEAGWLLDRHDDGRWTGWSDQGDRRFDLTIMPGDDSQTAWLVAEESGPAAAAPVPLELDGAVPTGELRVAGDVVLVPTPDALLGFEAATGQLRWEAEDCVAAQWASPIPGPVGSPAIAVCAGDLAAVEPATGAIAWRVPLRDFPERVRSSRTMVVLQTAASVRVLDMADGQERWNRSGRGDAAIAVDDDQVYIGNDDELRALDGDDAFVNWVMGGEIGAVAATDEAVFVRTNPTFPVGPGSNQLVRLDPEGGALRWSVAYHQRYDASAIAGATDEVVVLASDDHVAVFDAGTGEERWWEYTLGSALVAIGADTVIIGDTTTTHVIAYDALRHHQVRSLGQVCGPTTAVEGTTAAHLSCTGRSIAATVFDLRRPT